MLRRLIGVAILCLPLVACTQALILASVAVQHTSKVAEAVVAAKDGVTLKVVRYREYHPLSVIGYSYALQCRSAGARRGWVTLTDWIDSTSTIKQTVSGLNHDIRIAGGGIVV